MDVAISELRAHLSDWLARVREGEELVITDRGLPVARVTGIGTTPLLERLIEQGVIARPKRPKRPIATGRPRPRAGESLSDIVSEQRR
jgi:prevent-host-death family protein